VQKIATGALTADGNGTGGPGLGGPVGRDWGFPMDSPWIAMVFPGPGVPRCAGAVTEVDDSLGMDGALCQASAIQLVGGGMWRFGPWIGPWIFGVPWWPCPTKRIGTYVSYEHLTVK